jgi:hypothetical protein
LIIATALLPAIVTTSISPSKGTIALYQISLAIGAHEAITEEVAPVKLYCVKVALVVTGIAATASAWHISLVIAGQTMTFTEVAPVVQPLALVAVTL